MGEGDEIHRSVRDTSWYCPPLLRLSNEFWPQAFLNLPFSSYSPPRSADSQLSRIHTRAADRALQLSTYSSTEGQRDYGPNLLHGTDPIWP
jgi:hypothetical protein